MKKTTDLVPIIDNSKISTLGVEDVVRLDLENNTMQLYESLGITAKRDDQLSFIVDDIVSAENTTKATALFAISGRTDLSPIEKVYCAFRLQELWILKKYPGLALISNKLFDR